MGLKRNALSLLASAALAIGAVSTAASGPTGSEAIKARQKAMEEVNGAFKPLVAIARKEAPFDAEAVRRNAGTIADQLKAAAGLFPAGSEKGDLQTWAKPEVFTDAAGFEAALKASLAAAGALQAVEKEEAFGPALKELGGSCKGCHEKYRLPKH